jgi:hypothetical protein
MHDLITVNEKSTVWLSMSFEDRNGDPIVPESLTYRIDSSEGEEQPITNLNPANEVELEIPSNINVINSDTAYKTMYVTVVAVSNASQSEQQTKEFKYKIKQLRYL